MDVVCFGQQDWDHCWTGKQQLMTRIARRGCRVLYVDPEWDQRAQGVRANAARLRDGIDGCVRELEAGRLLHFRYRAAPALGWRLNRRRYLAQLRALVRRLHFTEPVAFALRPDAGPAMDAIDPALRVYYAVDEWSAFGGLRDDERQLLRRLEDELLQRIDLAIGVSPRLFERFRRTAPAAMLLECGADAMHFSPQRAMRLASHPRLAELPRPRIGFIGQVDDRLDEELVLQLARARPRRQIVLVGRVTKTARVDALAREPNVHLLGYQPYDELPRILRDLDVCILPYRSTELTESCNPLKVYEYLAAGKPVVATPLEGLRVCRGEIALARGAAAFTAEIDRALADPTTGRERRLALARRHDWSQRVDELLRELHAALRERRRKPPRGIGSRELARLPAAPETYDDYGFRSRQVAIGTFTGRAAFAMSRGIGRLARGVRFLARCATGRPAAVQRILVVRHTYLGDLVVFTSALQALRAAFPRARIVLGVQRGMGVRDLVATGGIVDDVLELDFMRDDSRLRRLAGIARLVLSGYDAVLSGLGFFLREEAFFAGAPKHYGIYNGHAWQRLLTRALPLDTSEHEVDVNVRLVEMLAGRALPTPLPRLFVDEAAGSAGCDALLRRLGVPDGAPLLVVHAGSRKASRRWPRERFIEVLRRVLAQRPELHVVLTGVASERPLCEEILAGLPPGVRSRAHDVAGTTEVATLVHLLRRARAALCNDSGVMHMARTLGTPLLALLGPENDQRWGPYRLGPGPAIAVRTVVPCAPCSRRTCDLHMCMRSLAVDTVLGHLDRLLDRAAEDHRTLASNGSPAAADGDGDVDLHELELHRSRLGFADLAAAGHELPLVSMVAVPAQRAGTLLGSPAPGADAGTDPAAGTPRHPDPDYPRIEIVEPGERDLAAVDSAAAWRQLVGATAGELIAVAEPGHEFATGEIAEHVAALLRQPLAVASLTRANGAGAPRRGVLRIDALPSTIAAWRSEAPRRTLLDWLDRHQPVMRVSAPVARGLATVATEARDDRYERAG